MRQNKINYLLLLLWIIFTVIFGIFDLDISKHLVNQNSGWAKFLEDYGMIPGLIVILSGIYIYYSVLKLQTDMWSIIRKIIFFLVSSGVIIYLFDILFEDIASSNFIFFSIVSLLLNLIIFIIIHKKQQVKNILVVKFAKVVVAVSLFGYVICIQCIKYLWGRVRYRQLDAAFSQFTPWYLPQGITGYDSFPSGHAAMGWILLPLMILLVNKKLWIRYSMFALIFIYSVVLAFSRVVIGAHYSSDVLFGSYFIIVTFFVFSKIYFSIDQRNKNL